jgi:homocitrate synthase NifV
MIMKQMVKIVDQTVNEALRLGTPLDTIKLMMPFMRKYSIETIDVSLQHLKNYGDRLEQILSLPLLRCKIHASLAEIAQVRKMGFSRVVITWSHQCPNSSLDQLTAVLAAAREFAQEIYLCIENAADFSAAQLSGYCPLLVAYEVKRLIYQDQESASEPFRVCQDLAVLQKLLPCPLEFHGHNAYGLATANSLAALRAGIAYVAAAVSGIGLPNHAATEEVLMAVKHLWKQDSVPSGRSLATDCLQVLSAMEISLPVDKALIGRDVFAHESGIHVDGITKDPLLYEVIQPEEVGQIRRLVVGKHSGTASLKLKFLQWNLELNQAEASLMLEKVRSIASQQKKSLSDLQLHQLYRLKNERSPRRLG